MIYNDRSFGQYTYYCDNLDGKQQLALFGWDLLLTVCHIGLLLEEIFCMKLNTCIKGYRTLIYAQIKTHNESL